MTYTKLPKVIFDKNYIDHLRPFDKFDNPEVIALCKRNEPSLNRLRNQMECWYRNLDDRDKLDIYKRLRSTNNAEFYSAFYELLFHQYFLEEGWIPTKNPRVNNLTPDFYVTTSSGFDFYLEIFGLFDDKTVVEQEKKMTRLLREVDKIQSHFLVSIHLKEWFPSKIYPKNIAESIQGWLLTLPRVDSARYEKEINEYGVHADVDAIYYPRVIKDGCIFSHGGPASVISHPTGRIKSMLAKKLNKYSFVKDSKKPFILVVTADDYGFPETAIDWTLYGFDVVSFPVNDLKGKSRFHKDNSGFITPNPGLLGQPKNTRLSALILARKKWDGKRMMYDMKVYHNPWAANPLPKEVFTRMAQFVEVDSPPGYKTLSWQNKDALIWFE